MPTEAGSTVGWRRGDVVLDLYEVRDIVRAGGMGLVYRVWHRDWQVDLAVKTPRRALVAAPAAVRAFRAEADTWVGLGLHPHVVSCVYVRMLGDVPLVFAEWADGGSLAEAVRRRRLSSLEQVLDVAIQSAWGLEHAHGRALVHRDVKPANVMLTSDGRAMITDFGLALASAAAGERPGGAGPLVSRGGLTEAYCSPEQARAASGEPQVSLTPATDVWSWGVTVLEMFTGGPPCEYGPSAGEALADLARSARQDAGLPVMPPGLADLLGRCLAPDPAARPDRPAGELVELYHHEVGVAYPRRRPEPAGLLADGFSNHALSRLDLGFPDRAEELWRQAVKAEPNHPHTVYNRGLHRWRTGRITDTDLLDELAAVRHSHQAAQVDDLVAGVRRERGGDVRTIVLEGHEEPVTAAALTPDGRTVVSGDEGGTLRVWDVGSGRQTSTIQVRQRIGVIALSGDGRVAAVGGGIGIVPVLDLADGRVLHRLSGRHRSWVPLVAMTADGHTLVTCGHDGDTVAWDLLTGRALALPATGRRPASALGGYGRLSAHVDHDRGRITVCETATGRDLYTLAGWNTSIVMSADGTVAIARTGRTCCVVDLATGTVIRTLDAGYDIAVSEDGRFLLSGGGHRRRAQLWELTTGRCRLTIDGDTGAFGSPFVLSREGTVAVSGIDREVRLHLLPPAGEPAPWSYARPRRADELSAHADRVDAALAEAEQLARAGRIAAAAATIRAARALPGFGRHAALMRTWRDLGRRGARVRLVDAWPAGGIVAGPTGSWALELNAHSPVVVARNGNDGDAWVFDLDSGQRRHTLGLHAGTVNGAALSRDGRLVVTAGEDGRVAAWDTTSGRIRQLFDGHRAPVWAVALRADGRVAMSGTSSGEVAIWDVPTGRCLGRRAAHDGPVLSLAVGDRFAVSRGDDNELLVWDVRSGRRRRALRGHTGWTGPVAIGARGRLASSAGEDGTVRVWRLPSGRSAAVLDGHTAHVVDVVVSDDGRQVLSGSVDGTLWLWDLPSGACRRVLQGHKGAVTSLAVTPDFGLAASGGEDGEIRLWDLAAGSCLRTFAGPPAGGDRVVLTDDGGGLLATGESGELRTWALDWEYELPDRVAPVDAARSFGELRDEAAPALPVREDRYAEVVAALSGHGPRFRTAATRILEVARELDHIPGSSDTAIEVYVREVDRRREERPGSVEPTTAEALAMLVRRDDWPGRDRVIWPEVFRRRWVDDLTALAEGAALLQAEARPELAELTWRLVVDVRSRLFSPTDTDTQSAMLGLADLLLAAGRPTEAEPLSRTVFEQRRSGLGIDHPATGDAAVRLAAALLATGRRREGRRLLGRTIRLLEHRYGPADDRVTAARRLLDEGGTP